MSDTTETTNTSSTLSTNCSVSGGDCVLLLPTPCGACASESACYGVHPVTGETMDMDELRAQFGTEVK